jgi:tetratricopeptide (TPR) repeat protein
MRIGPAAAAPRLTVVLLLTATVTVTATAAAQDAPADRAKAGEALRQQAMERAYNLDRPEALALLDEAVRVDPDHPAGHRLIASLAWLRILWDRGMVNVDDYLGSLATKDVALEQAPPRAELVSTYTQHIDAARERAERRLAQAPNDPSALYEMGAVYGLETSYHASVEGRMLKSFGLARKAYAANARALTREPARYDAGYYIGAYRCVVAELPAPMRWFAYLGGLRGGKKEGLALLEAAASHPGEAQAQARYTLVLLYNRDKRYRDAIRILDEERRLYPRNRQFVYEAAATWLRAGEAAQALPLLTEGIDRLETDRRPRWMDEESLWHYQRGVASQQLGRLLDARRDFETALTFDAHAWVHQRTRLALTRVADALAAVR